MSTEVPAALQAAYDMLTDEWTPMNGRMEREYANLEALWMRGLAERQQGTLRGNTTGVLFGHCEAWRRALVK